MREELRKKWRKRLNYALGFGYFAFFYFKIIQHWSFALSLIVAGIWTGVILVVKFLTSLKGKRSEIRCLNCGRAYEKEPEPEEEPEYFEPLGEHSWQGNKERKLTKDEMAVEDGWQLYDVGWECPEYDKKGSDR